MKNTMDITNGHGITMRAKLIQRGERYGAEDSLTYQLDVPMIEFYDTRYEYTKGLGQFVSSYYLDTFHSATQRMKKGLQLDMGVPVWSITDENVQVLSSWTDTLIKAPEPFEMDEWDFLRLKDYAGKTVYVIDSDSESNIEERTLSLEFLQKKDHLYAPLVRGEEIEDAYLEDVWATKEEALSKLNAEKEKIKDSILAEGVLRSLYRGWFFDDSEVKPNHEQQAMRELIKEQFGVDIPE